MNYFTQSDTYNYDVAKQIEKKWSPKLEEIQKEYSENIQVFKL